MKLTIENKAKVLGKIVKHDIVMLLPEMIHKGETYLFKAKDDRNRDYSWQLTRYCSSGRYEMLFSDGQRSQSMHVEKQAIENVDNFLYICAAMISY
jgi:hypothetical protein